MLGAIIGDVVGSRFEFNNHRSKEFELVTNECSFTDDTVLTIALMDWILHSEVKDEKTSEKYLKKWGRHYPLAGYGYRFTKWLLSNDIGPYNSKGNGNAMRISPVGWCSNDKIEIELLSYMATAVTHNHPEGINGASVVAKLICMARNGVSKEELKAFAEKSYSLDFDYEDLKKNYQFNELSETTVPQAIYCFLISNNFEDCLRISVSIGGDTDTLCAISCAIAEAYYKEIDNKLVNKVKSLLTPEMIEIVNEFKEKYGGM